MKETHSFISVVWFGSNSLLLSQLTQPPFLPLTLSSLCVARRRSPILASRKGGGTRRIRRGIIGIIQYIKYQSVCPFIEMWSPLFRKSVCLPPWTQRGGVTFNIGMRGWEAQFGLQDGTLYTLWVDRNHATGKKFDLLPFNYFMIPSMQTSKKPCFLEQNKTF